MTGAYPPCLLDYRFSTMPTPLQASPSTGDASGMINIWAGPPPGDPVYCSIIELTVPVGIDANQLCRTVPTITPNVTAWRPSSIQMSDGEDFGLPIGDYYTFAFECPADKYWKIDYELVFSLVASEMSRFADTFPYAVRETSAPNGTDPHVRHQNDYTLSKVPSELYLDNFVAVSAATSDNTQPRTAFTNKEPIKLEWRSNGSSFSLYAGRSPDPLWTGKNTYYTLNAGMTADGTYTLVATLDQVVRRSTIDLTVTNPGIAPKSVTTGQLTADTAQFGDATLKTVNLVGTAKQLRAFKLSTLADVTTSSLSVDNKAILGSTTASSATVDSTMSVGQKSTLGAMTASSLSLSAAALFGGQNLNPGTTYTASSDGIVMGYVISADSVMGSATRIAARSGTGSAAYASGGWTCVYASKYEVGVWEFRNTLALPVTRNTTFTLEVNRRTGADTVRFFWVPFARNGQVTELGPADEPPEWPEPTSRRHPDTPAQVQRVIDAAAPMFGERLTPQRREQLSVALLAIADPRRHSYPAAKEYLP